VAPWGATGSSDISTRSQLRGTTGRGAANG
jgi:hypothetical protein